ncbi:MAG: hypothetical protein WCC12_15920 [Anaerolineales bacterium]
MDFKNLNFTDFVRYSLTGLNFILFVILLPAIYFAPNLIQAIISETSVLTILLFSIAIGFLMDMLKVYQFAPKYTLNKRAFRKKIAEMLEIPVEQASSYFSITTKIWDENSPYNFERRRAEWVLVMHTAAALFLSSFVWLSLAVSEYLRRGLSERFYLPALIVVVALLLTVRLYRVGTRTIARDDQEFLLIMSANKKRIKEAWKLADKKQAV